MASFIKIILRGPTMSFGGDMVSPKWRGTNDRPTMSFVIGFLCSCLGLPFRRALSEVKALRDALKVHVIILKPGRREIDYQGAGAGYDPENDLEKMCLVVKDGGGGTSDVYQKEMIEDGKFDIILEMEDEALAKQLVGALKRPTWFPFIGRKAHHLSDMPFGGTYDTFESAIAGYPKGTLCIQHVDPTDEKSEPVKDYPLCEGDNKTTIRYVKEFQV